MEYILDTALFTDLARRDLLVAFDFDGTLAPIVARPGDASMRPQTRRLLSQVARVYPCAVISGRSEQDLLQHLAGVTVWYAVGSGCLEPPDPRWKPLVRGWWRTLSGGLTSLPGVVIEDKETSLAVHYRAAQERERAREAILSAATLLERVRIVAGKEVVNLVPDDAPHKGVAVEKLRAQIGAREVLYVGDDRSDEDVFALSCVHGVRIGEGESGAQFRLRDQEEIDEFLERLLDVRARPERRPEAPRPGRRP